MIARYARTLRLSWPKLLRTSSGHEQAFTRQPPATAEVIACFRVNTDFKVLITLSGLSADTSLL